MGESDGNGGYVLNSDRQSIITSLLSAGTFFGALGQTLTSDRIGRKGSIIFWSTIVSSFYRHSDRGPVVSDDLCSSLLVSSFKSRRLATSSSPLDD